MLRPFKRSQTSLALNSILESLAVNFKNMQQGQERGKLALGNIGGYVGNLGNIRG